MTFNDWVIKHAKNTDINEMLEDDVFVSRLINDVIWGRSKRFNRAKGSGESSGLAYLRDLYAKEVASGTSDMP